MPNQIIIFLSFLFLLQWIENIQILMLSNLYINSVIFIIMTIYISVESAFITSLLIHTIFNNIYILNFYQKENAE